MKLPKELDFCTDEKEVPMNLRKIFELEDQRRAVAGTRITRNEYPGVSSDDWSTNNQIPVHIIISKQQINKLVNTLDIFLKSEEIFEKNHYKRHVWKNTQ